MAPRHPALPPAAFTKGEVNRAGELVLALRERMQRDGPARGIAEFDEEELERAWEALRWWRSLHARPLSTVAANLRYHVDRGDALVRGRIEVTQRLKRLDTLIGKLAREKGNVTQMHDIGGVRAVLPSQRHVYVVRRRLLKSWMIIRERDYVATPKESGYRALHLIVRRNGYPVEVQLRTIGQDIWANTVEEIGRQVGVGLKFGAGDPRLHSIFVAMSEVLARFDRAEMSSDELRAALKSLPSLTITTEGRSG
jgi:putative GTP pyrophosphokinase